MPRKRNCSIYVQYGEGQPVLIFQEGITRSRPQLSHYAALKIRDGYRITHNEKDSVTLQKGEDTITYYMECDPPAERGTGPGRPRLGEEPAERMTVTLSPEHLKQLRTLGNGNVSAGIRKALENMSGEESQDG